VKLYEDEEGYFMNLPGRTISLDEKVTLKQFKDSIIKQYPNIDRVHVYDEKLVEYADSSPTALLTSENFLLKLNEEWYSINADTEHPLFSTESKHTLNQRAINTFCQTSGLTSRQSAILTKFVSNMIEDIHQNNQKTIDKHQIELVLEKTIMHHAIEAKQDVETINKKLEYLREKLKKYEEAKKAVDDKLLAKARRRLKYFFSFVFAQIMAIQYGTYVAFSWDIMEPITCLLGIFDLIVAYSFWLFTNNPYSFKAIERRFVEKRKARFYKKDELDLEELEEINKLIANLEARKAFLSSSLEDVIRGLELDTEKKAKTEEEE